MDSHSDMATLTSRKIRKGAHSCQECRRRKVKCIYAEPSDSTCIVCKRRGSSCISQYRLLMPEHNAHKDHRTRGDNTGDGPTSDSTVNSTTSIHAREPGPQLVRSPRRTVAAVSALGEGVSTNGRDSSRSRHRVKPLPLPESQAHIAITDALLRSLPSKEDISILEGKISPVSAISYHSGYKFQASGSAKTLEAQVPFRSLLDPESHPTLLARQMLLFSAALQDLSPREVVHGLTEHHRVIMRNLAESAIKLVNMEDALLGTLEGLENLIFEFFYHADGGNIQRAWITTRRAIMAAQMLGLHRPDHYRFVLIKSNSDLQPEVMWATVVSMERILSLLLGLPTSTSDITLATQSPASRFASGYNLTAMVANFSMRILQRNKVEPAQEALDMTADIDRDIIRAAEQLPSAFWRVPAFAGLERNSLKALTETRRAFSHMCYYIIVVQLHLPYILSHHDAAQREYSKIACINAGKEILAREIELRTFNPTSACCRMGDFIAVIAGMALMLGHITSHGGDERDRFLAHQRLGDRATVERALGCVDAMFDLDGDVLAVRCADLLRDLLAIEEDIARYNSPRVTQGDRGMVQRDILIVRVPYLGSVRISRDGVATLPSSSMEPAQSTSEETITIGGIGSMSISQRQVFAHSEDDSNFPTLIPSTVSASETFDQDPDTYDPPLIAANWPTQYDTVYPEAAASLEEWAFQGVDTAFMEALMRGSSTLLSDSHVHKT